MSKLTDNFNEEEMSTIIELARVALSNSNTYSFFANELDLRQKWLDDLLEKIDKFSDGSADDIMSNEDS